MAIGDMEMALSGERFTVVYRIEAGPAEAADIARALCLEQTVELPEALVPPAIRAAVVGSVEAVRARADGASDAAVSYAVETAGGELTQLLNVVFGNSSLKPGIRVEALELPPALLELFPGPRFGAEGLRRLVGAPERPLLCTALKPLGLGAAALARLAHQCALGGIDVIKDDHGLADQPFAPFHERVRRCAAAVAQANVATGGGSVYAPNVTAPAGQVLERAFAAQEAGAGAVLIAPGLTGFDAMRQLAADPSFRLAILSHPAFLGGFVASPSAGIGHGALFGTITRLAGADATIFPNYGGRFSFSRAECEQIAGASAAPLGQLRPMLPTPAGGMTLERVGEMLAVYGRDVMLLMGGGLYGASDDLVAACRSFRALVER